MRLPPTGLLVRTSTIAVRTFWSELFKKLFDEDRSFEFVEGFGRPLEELLGDFLNLGFIQLVFVHDLQDQIALFVRTVPLVTVGLAGMAVGAGLVRPMTVAGAGAVEP